MKHSPFALWLPVCAFALLHSIVLGEDNIADQLVTKDEVTVTQGGANRFFPSSHSPADVEIGPGKKLTIIAETENTGVRDSDIRLVIVNGEVSVRTEAPQYSASLILLEPSSFDAQSSMFTLASDGESTAKIQIEGPAAITDSTMNFNGQATVFESQNDLSIRRSAIHSSTEPEEKGAINAPDGVLEISQNTYMDIGTLNDQINSATERQHTRITDSTVVLGGAQKRVGKPTIADPDIDIVLSTAGKASLQGSRLSVGADYAYEQQPAGGYESAPALQTKSDVTVGPHSIVAAVNSPTTSATGPRNMTTIKHDTLTGTTPASFATDAVSLLDTTEGKLTVADFDQTKLNGQIRFGDSAAPYEAQLIVEDTKLEVGSSAKAVFSTDLTQVLNDLKQEVTLIEAKTGGSPNFGALAKTRSTLFGQYDFGTDAATGKLRRTGAARTVDLSRMSAQDRANFRSNMRSLYGEGAARSDLGEVILARAQAEVQGMPTADASAAGQFNQNMLRAMENGPDTLFEYAPKGMQNAVRLARVSRGLVEMSVGATVGKTAMLNQDTHMQMLSGVHNRFSELRFADWQPVSTPVPNADCGPAAPAEPAPVVSEPLTDDFCEPCGNLGPIAYGNLALLYPSLDQTNRVWVSPLGILQNASADRGFAGYKYNAGGVQVGYDRVLGSVTVGAAFGYLGGRYSDKAMDSNDSKIHNYGLTAYALYSHPSNWYATVVGGWTYADNKLAYTTAGMRWRQKHHANTWSIEARAGYDFMTQQEVYNWRVTPSVGLGYISTRTNAHDAYNESVGAATMRYGRQKLSTGYVPLQVEGEFVASLQSGAALSIAANAGYTYLTSKDPIRGDMGLVGLSGVPAWYSTTGWERGRHVLTLGTGLKYITPIWEAGAKYDYARRSKTNTHRAYGYVGVRF